MKQFAQVNKAKLSGRARSRCIRNHALPIISGVQGQNILYHSKKKISQAAQNMVVPIYRTEIN